MSRVTCLAGILLTPFGTASRREWVTCTRSRKAAISSVRSASTHKFAGRRDANDASGEIESFFFTFSQIKFTVRKLIRDYKEHGARRGDDIASSTPSLNRDALDKSVRSWTSTQNLSSNDQNNVVEVTAPLRLRQRPSSWSSTPDLEEAQKNQRILPKPVEEVIVNLQLPVRKRHTVSNFDNVEESFTLKRPPPSPTNGNPPRPLELDDNVIINKTDSLAERVRKMQMIKRQGSLERDSSREGSIPTRFLAIKIWKKLFLTFFNFT